MNWCQSFRFVNILSIGGERMVDCHYDLLTILYCCYLKNDFSYIKKIQEDLKEVDGLIANLYFMSKKEMEEELHITEINVVEMFQISTKLFQKYFKDKKVIYSIEGCDYIKDEKELEELYHLGLRNILLVWNNENQYGSGNRSEKGLTDLGKSFIRKAVDLGIMMDLSHMNKNTFYDTTSLLKELKKEGKNFTVIASHSNSYSLCPHPRNLEDNQMLELKELDGKIGIVSYGPFIEKNSKNLEEYYLKQIKYVEGIVGIDSVMVSTDNMEFATDLFGIEEGTSLFSHKTIKKTLYEILKKDYNEEKVEKIIKRNALELLEEMKIC